MMGRIVWRWVLADSGRMVALREVIYPPSRHRWDTCRAARGCEARPTCAVWRRPVWGAECRHCEHWQYRHARPVGCKAASGVTRLGRDLEVRR